MDAARRRKFTDDEKRSIVEEAGKRGISTVLHEHKLSYSVFSRWKQKFQPGSAKEKQDPRKALRELKELELENERLKRIVASQALEIQIQTEKLRNFHRVDQ